MTIPTTEVSMQNIESRIFRVEDRPPFMLADDLADIYGARRKQVYQSVQRNPDRFPADFCFRLTKEDILRLQNATAIKWNMARTMPLVFTRFGANMLSACLKTPIAVRRAVQIMRAFSMIEDRLSESNSKPEPKCDEISMSKDRFIELQEEIIALQKNELERLRGQNKPKWAVRRPFTKEEIVEARSLREQGFGVKEIGRRMGRAAGSISMMVRYGGKGGAQ